MSHNNFSSQRLSLPIQTIYQQDSTGRTFSPIAFFHDGVSTSEIDLRFNIIGSQRRAQAIATAPRRKRHDDDEEDEEIEQNKSFLGFVKTAAVPIRSPPMSQQTQSLPQTQSGIGLIPSFRVDPPTHHEDNDAREYLYNHNSLPKRYSSTPLP